MTLFEALLEQYGTNEPILSTDITFECYSRPWIMKQLSLSIYSAMRQRMGWRM